MAESDTILQLGIEAAREGNREEARNLFNLLTRQEPENLQAWLWLAGVAEGPEQRRVALERVLQLDPTNEMAIKGLQAMGAAQPARSERPTPAPVAPRTPAKPELSDEERFAAELDSAFDDYDAVPRTPTPPRPEPIDFEPEEHDVPPPRSTPVNRASSRDRLAARRSQRPGRLLDESEGMLPTRRVAISPRLLLGLLGAVLVVLIVIFIIIPALRGNQAASSGNKTTIPTLTGGSTATAELALTPVLIPTVPLTETLPLTETMPTEVIPTSVPPPADVSGANPAVVPVGTTLELSGWSYNYPDGTYAAVLGPQQGAFTAQGSYVVVLVHVANTTGTDQPLPKGFFVLKDAQGRVYEAQPQVSNDYIIPGVNADTGMEEALPANGVTTSIPLIFDVQPGATNLVLFARGKTDQGWQVLSNVP